MVAGYPEDHQSKKVFQDESNNNILYALGVPIDQI